MTCRSLIDILRALRPSGARDASVVVVDTEDGAYTMRDIRGVEYREGRVVLIISANEEEES